MLRVSCLKSMSPSHVMTAFALGLCIAICSGLTPSRAYAQEAIHIQESEKPKVLILVNQNARDDYSYRKTNNTKVISVMLYGFAGDQANAVSEAPSIMKDKRSLSSFFRNHLEQAKRDYFGQDGTQSVNLIAGGSAFNSMPLNRGPDLEPAKMVGFTTPAGRFMVGGGYTWGEKNPAMMRLTKSEGLFVGASYDVGSTRFQFSYLSSGQKLAGFKVGGTDIRYDNLMFGTSFRVNKRVGLTTTIQYRNDKDPLTTGDQQLIFTVGTKWKF
jgi:hypothetical protein